ncbi:DNA polymerase III subunit chi [Sagittula salina]|uniref:DNA polymerase III subunit chi n=1 Tax=Sagittula salina TaxID=2820268 RepID=A0A940MM64_9RHOB|nr:DNA polymerase III subunit chi [Sagittula salina]MBP0481013.1 DNA polymerase III subunit chi [Sagittula salina]
MGNVLFYHLTRQPLDVTLSMLLGKSLERGWRVVVRGADAGRLEWLDQRLWLQPEDGFLPHGLAGGPHDAAQPVLLTAQPELPNDPACLMALDGAEISLDEVDRLDRSCILFDGQDGAAVQMARGQWKALTGAGAKAQYWSEESGRWEKKAES